MTGLRETSLDELRLDHRVEVDGRTGAARVAVPVRLSEGREGFGPALTLVHAGAAPSPFGTGWALSGLEAIATSLRAGVPAHREGDRFEHGGEELVPFVRPGAAAPASEERGPYRVERWRSRVERGWQRFERWVERAGGRVHWVRRDPDGAVSVFGLAADGSTRIADPADPRRVWQWLLEAQYHPRGSAIRWNYKAEDGAGVDAARAGEGRRVRSGGGFAQRYPKRILYGNTRPLSLDRPDDAANGWCFEVVFDYGEHGGGPVPSHAEARPWPVRADPTSTSRAGFEVRTWRLCRRLLVFHRFAELGPAPCLVGETALEHREDPAGAVLAAVSYRGWRRDPAGGAPTSRALPALSFTYSEGEVEPAFRPADLGGDLPAGLDGASIRWVDLRGEGLPGFLSRWGGAWYYKENLGDGRFGPLARLDEHPAAPAGFQLQDFDGDGNLDLVAFEGREAGRFVRERSTGRWTPFRALRDLPRVDFAGARVEWVDLDGDGRPELVVDHGDRLSWYRSEGADGFAPAVEIARPDRRAGGGARVAQDEGQRTFFADMDGDGLVDLVRIDPGRVEYWPNLGHGRFGPPVPMENAPALDAADGFDPRRVRLVDLDGTGTADLVWLGDGELRIFPNQAGNGFGPERRVRGLPVVDHTARVDVLDFLGEGGACLVWSSPLPGRGGPTIQSLRLTGATRPRLLAEVSDGMGRRTRLDHRSSVRDHLRDRGAGRPWTRLLPHHPTVVGRLEVLDEIGGARAVTRYEYRDGDFDGVERRFAGFARCDTFDADELVAGPGLAAEEVSPPTLLRRFYLTGEPGGGAGPEAGAYRGDPLHARLPPPALEDVAGLTTEEQLEAFRVLAGAPWREERYALRPDGTVSPHPLQTSETAFAVRRLQPAAPGRPGAFAAWAAESLQHLYEDDPTDPRVLHGLVLDVGPYGEIARQLAVVYPRRPGGAELRPEQQVLHVDLTDAAHARFDEAGRYELGIPVSAESRALHGLAPPAAGVLSREAARAQVQAALARTLGIFDAPTGAPEVRRTRLERTRYWDAVRAAALPPGAVGPVTLVHHEEKAFLPADALAAAFEGRVDAASLAADGRYVAADGFFWAAEEVERPRGPEGFFLVQEAAGSSGTRQRTTHDPYFLFPVLVEDASGNQVRTAIDYQALAPWQVTDPNGNVAETRYDALRVAVASTVRGEALGRDGNPHPVGDEPIAGWAEPAALTASDVLADPGAALQGATRFQLLDLGAFGRGAGPPASVLVDRETHRHDGEGGAPGPGRLRVEVQYLDGFGRVLQRKVAAGGGPAIQRDAAGRVMLEADGAPRLAEAASRWFASGHQVLDQQGRAVRVHAPFFTTRAAYEADAALRAAGTTRRLSYDPAGRVVREDLPDGTVLSRAFGAWSTRESDAGDNVIGSPWEAERAGLPAADPRRRALDQARLHARTPVVTVLDGRGHPTRRRESDEHGAVRETLATYGPHGLPERMVDARGNVVAETRYDLMGRALRERSADAGVRTTLLDAADRPVHRWDGRGVHVTSRHDAAGRPSEIAVEAPGRPRRVVERLSYGDAPGVPQAALRNVRGQVVRHEDAAGVVELHRYHLGGAVQEVSRALLADHRLEVDWAGPAPALAPAIRVRLALDAQGRVTRRELPDGTVREYEYAPLGHLSALRLTTADGRLDRVPVASGIEHDALGRRTRLVLGNGVTTSWAWDPRSARLARLQAARGGPAPRAYLDLSYTYDPVGNVTHLVDAVQDPGAPAPFVQGLGVSAACEYTYDAFHQLRTATGRVHQALLPQDAWSADGGGVVAGTRHLRLDNGAAVERYTRTYDHDLAGNLTRTRHQGAARAWSTDVWVSPTSNRSLPAVDLNGNPVGAPETWFDENGNTIRLPHLRALRWDHQDRLVRATIVDRSAAGGPDDAEYYAWGADGRRVRRVTERLVAGAVEVAETVWFDQCEIRRVVRGGGTRLLRFTSHVQDGDQRIATLHRWAVDLAHAETDDPGELRLRYLAGNHLGSVALELDAAGGVVSYEEYFPYGGTSFAAGPAARDVSLRARRYAGQLRDDATGLYHFEFREYLPWIGHWLSPDPSGLEDGPNRYAYVHGNPVRFVDPDGLQATAPQVTPVITHELPEGIQAMLAADPALSARFDRGEIFFHPAEGGGWTYLTRTDVDAMIRAENQAGEIPELTLFEEAPELTPAEQAEQIMEAIGLEELLRPLRELDQDLQAPPGAGGGVEAGEGAEGSGEEGGGEAVDAPGEGDAGTVHPADGSLGAGDAGDGRTGESGSNGDATTGTDVGAGDADAGPGGDGEAADGGEEEAHEGAEGAGEGGRGTGGTGGTGDATRTGRAGGTPGRTPGAEGGVEGGVEGGGGTGGRGLPPVPPGHRTGPDGIPYSSELPPPPSEPGTGATTTDPSLVHPGLDARSDPASDAGGTRRPNGTGGRGATDGARDGSEAGNREGGRGAPEGERGDAGAGPPETALERATRWAGYLNLVFENGEGSERGGAPGGLGLLGLRGAVFQVLYIVSTIVSTILMVHAIVKSISFAALRQGLGRLLTAIRNPLALLQGAWTGVRGFFGEATTALRTFLRGRTPWWRTITRLVWEDRALWNSIRSWRNSSFWYRERWFGIPSGPGMYSTEHVFITENLARRFPALAGLSNGYWNTFLRLPFNFNASLQNRVLPRLVFYGGALESLRRSWNLGWSVGDRAADELYAEPEERATTRGLQPAQ